MSLKSQLLYWAAFTVAVGILVYLLRSVLLPFAAGLAVAYFLDPAVDRVERLGITRTLATMAITALFFSLVTVAAILLAPLIQAQVVSLVEAIPERLQRLSEVLAPLLEKINAVVATSDRKPGEAAALVAEKGASILVEIANSLLTSGLAFFSLLSLLFITPIVSFYLLRDWDKMKSKVKAFLPRDHAKTIAEQLHLVDRALAGFLRGQATVCLVQAMVYASGLTAIGLQFGLVIGLLSGFLAFVPYVGLVIGLVTALILAVLQHGLDVAQLALVVAVFGFVQVLDQALLTPKLVGGKVGLHPAWIIFALLAGSVLFGFVGLLLAVPIASAIGVLVRFALGYYVRSRLYRGVTGVGP
ncbi:MAG: AI-2E family transporter [Alphaproteobacteria bacterium]|nr:AI-2E family transporter [Alphaproteobacteria bacterium]